MNLIKKDIKSISNIIKKHLNNPLESMYLGLEVIFILKYGSFEGLWSERVDLFLRLVLCMVITLRVWHRKHSRTSDMFLIAIALMVFMLSRWHGQYAFLLDTVLLMIGAVDIPYKKVLKTGFWTAFCDLIAIAMGTVIGVIWEMVFVRGGPPEHTFGTSNPNNFGARVFYVLVFGWVLYSEVLSVWIIVITFLLAKFLYVYTGSATSAGMLCISALGMLYVFIRTNFVKKCRFFDRVFRCFEWVLVFVMPILALITNVLTKIYDGEKPWLVQLNGWSHGRLTLGKNAMQVYGLKSFGSFFEMSGWQWTSNGLVTAGYNFVDCAYVQIAVRYGVITLVMYCVLMALCSGKALKSGQLKVVVAMALIALHGVMEYYFIQINFNLLLLLPFAYFQEEQDSLFRLDRKKLCYTLYLGVIGLIGVLLFPAFTVLMRTAIFSMWTSKGLKYTYFLAGAVLFVHCIYMMVKNLWLALSKILLERNSAEKQAWRKKVEKCIWNRLVCYGAVLGLFFAACLVAVGHGRKTYANILETERPVLQALAESEEIDGIYIDDLPLLYQGKYENIAFSPFRGDGLVDKENIVLLTTTDRDLTVLLRGGFSCGQFSGIHAVYTNSEAARDILAGYGILQN